MTWQKCKLRLKSSGSTMKGLSDTKADGKLDPMGKQGSCMIKEGITHDEGVHIIQYISTDFMRLEPF